MRVNWCLIKALVQIVMASIIRDAINQRAEGKPAAPWRHPSRHLARRQSGISVTSLPRRLLFWMLCCLTRQRRRRRGRLASSARINLANEGWSFKFGLIFVSFNPRQLERAAESAEARSSPWDCCWLTHSLKCVFIEFLLFHLFGTVAIVLFCFGRCWAKGTLGGSIDRRRHWDSEKKKRKCKLAWPINQVLGNEWPVLRCWLPHNISVFLKVSYSVSNNNTRHFKGHCLTLPKCGKRGTALQVEKRIFNNCSNQLNLWMNIIQGLTHEKTGVASLISS